VCVCVCVCACVCVCVVLCSHTYDVGFSQSSPTLRGSVTLRCDTFTTTSARCPIDGHCERKPKGRSDAVGVVVNPASSLPPPSSPFSSPTLATDADDSAVTLESTTISSRCIVNTIDGEKKKKPSFTMEKRIVRHFFNCVLSIGSVKHTIGIVTGESRVIHAGCVGSGTDNVVVGESDKVGSLSVYVDSGTVNGSESDAVSVAVVVRERASERFCVSVRVRFVVPPPPVVLPEPLPANVACGGTGVG